MSQDPQDERTTNIILNRTMLLFVQAIASNKTNDNISGSDAPLPAGCAGDLGVCVFGVCPFGVCALGVFGDSKDAVFAFLRVVLRFLDKISV